MIPDSCRRTNDQGLSEEQEKSFDEGSTDNALSMSKVGAPSKDKISLVDILKENFNLKPVTVKQNLSPMAAPVSVKEPQTPSSSSSTAEPGISSGSPRSAEEQMHTDKPEPKKEGGDNTVTKPSKPVLKINVEKLKSKLGKIKLNTGKDSLPSHQPDTVSSTASQASANLSQEIPADLMKERKAEATTHESVKQDDLLQVKSKLIRLVTDKPDVHVIYVSDTKSSLMALEDCVVVKRSRDSKKAQSCVTSDDLSTRSEQRSDDKLKVKSSHKEHKSEKKKKNRREDSVKPLKSSEKEPKKESFTDNVEDNPDVSVRNLEKNPDSRMRKTSGSAPESSKCGKMSFSPSKSKYMYSTSCFLVCSCHHIYFCFSPVKESVTVKKEIPESPAKVQDKMEDKLLTPVTSVNTNNHLPSNVALVETGHEDKPSENLQIQVDQSKKKKRSESSHSESSPAKSENKKLKKKKRRESESEVSGMKHTNPREVGMIVTNSRKASGQVTTGEVLDIISKVKSVGSIMKAKSSHEEEVDIFASVRESLQVQQDKRSAKRKRTTSNSQDLNCNKETSSGTKTSECKFYLCVCTI